MGEKKEKEIDVNNVKNRIDYTFYSNVLNVNRSNVDAYIDFMRFPLEDDLAPTVRIFLSPSHLKEFIGILNNLPEIPEEDQE